MEEKIEITLSRYEELLEAESWLSCLEAAGVDNWQGIDYAHDLMSNEVAK